VCGLKEIDSDGSGHIQLNEFQKWWKREDRWGSIQLQGFELEKRKELADIFNKVTHTPINTVIARMLARAMESRARGA